jgi:hypothetical protein
MAFDRVAARTRCPDRAPDVAAVQTHGMGIPVDPLEIARSLLDRAATVRHGFLDVLGEARASGAAETPTPAQRAMNSALVAGVYERLWRPVAFYVASGVTTRTEQRRAAPRTRYACRTRPDYSISPVAQEISPENWLNNCQRAALQSGWTSPCRC